MTTSLIIAHDHLIRALYAAKEAMKNASSNWQTAEHNLADSKADRSTTPADLERIKAEESEAYAVYVKAEKTYDSCHHACNRLGLLG
jgi:hypothetical protein